MKNRTKLIVASAAALVLAAGVATTSSVAWFSATTTRSLSAASYSTVGGEGFILQPRKTGTTTVLPTTYGTGEVFKMSSSWVKDQAAYTVDSQAGLYDCSGNGAAMYKPAWTNQLNKHVSAVGDAALNNTTGCYAAFDLFFYSASSTNVDITLATLTFTPVGTAAKDYDSVMSARIALYEGSTLAFYGNPYRGSAEGTVASKTNAKAATYISSDVLTSEATNKNYETKNEALETETSAGSGVYTTTGLGIHTANAVQFGDVAAFTSVKVLDSVTQATGKTLKVVVWLNGEDTSCGDEAIGGSFNIGMSFTSVAHA